MTRHVKNIKGQRFGKWTVLKFHGNDQAGSALWLCLCDCGVERLVGGERLRVGRSKSCGCMKSKNLIGRVFGRLRVVRQLPPAPTRKSIWSCRCDCGRKCIAYGTNLLRNLTKSCGCLRREIMQSRMTGPSHYGWKGGITPEVQRIRNHQKMRDWKRSVFKRDKFTCQKCSTRGGKLEADHYPKPFRDLVAEIVNSYGVTNLYEKALKHAPMWEIANGRTLCYGCHRGKK